MRKYHERGEQSKNKVTKCSISSNRATPNSSSIYNEIRLQTPKFYEEQQKNPKDHRHKHQNLRQILFEKAKVNPEFDLGEGKKMQPFLNNYIQHTYSDKFNQEHKTKVYDRIIYNSPKKKKNQIHKKDFTYQYIIGKGGFGKVWKVEHTKRKTKYAMKQMLKSIILTKKSVQSILNEQKILTSLHSPFIVNIQFAFQDREILYLALDLMEGGDLRHHLNTKIFTEAQAKFFIGCLILGLQYIHKNQIIHRDIKPQNIVFDSKGYPRITDFGIARMYRPKNSSDTSGTPGYMSPQVICRQNHSFVSDFFAIGVIAYELMLKKRPYAGYSRSQIRQNILAKQALVKPYQVPHDWNMSSMDFINRLLQRKPENRLGYLGVSQIKNHPWINNIDWVKLLKKQIESPFIPCMTKYDFDQDEQITIEDEEQGELIEKNSLLLRKQEFQELFSDYYYYQEQPKRELKSKTILQRGRKIECENEKMYIINRNRVKQKMNFHNYTQTNSRNSLNGSRNNFPYNVQDFLLLKK